MKDLSFFVGIIPIAIVGAISRFDLGSSTHAQRMSIMLWLVWGIFLGWLVTIWQSSDVLEKKPEKAVIESILLRALFFIFLGAPAIVGWVVVGQMLMEYGTCIVLP